jgi:pimeloyl-ACP methyl ester carboxylesterase
MQSAFISFKSSQIHYCHCGKGRKLLLCLHGYGETQQSFYFLEKHIGADYQLLAIDLPFHGKTSWNEGMTFTISDLLAIIESIRAACSINTSSTTLLGFSMGGRIALGILQQMPAGIERLVLLAPDGLKVNFWYWLATQTYLGNRLFKVTMYYPQWFFFILKLGNSLRIVNLSIFKFIHHYLHDNIVRRQLYQRWTCMRSIKPNLPLLKKFIRSYAIPVRLLYGQYDRIIRFERAEKFKRGIESFCTLQIIEAGHQVLHEKNADLIIRLIQS